MKQFLKRTLLAAMLCLPWVTQAQTDTLTVADGTETNSYVPFYGLWMDASQHNQVLYPASLTAAIVGDSITGMGFYMSSSNSSAWGSTVTVSLGISSNAALTGLDNSTVLTQVWQGTVNGQGNIWIVFDNAYAFQGGNLLVDIQTTAGTYGSASFYGISQNGGSYYQYNSSGGVRDFIPKTSFLHVEGDFEVCLMPSNLVVDLDSNQIAISWNPAAGVSGYNVYLNDSLVSGSVTDTFYVFDNLTSNTVYSVSVTSVCTDGESPAIGGTYRTDCSLMQIPFFTSFENDPYGEFPPCWTRTIANGTDPSVNTVFSHTGSQSMYLQASTGYNLFASQAIPLDGNNIKVDFWARLSASYEGWIQAGVMTNPTQENTFIPLLYINDMAGTWKHYNFSTHDLDANTTYYVAFKYYGTGAYNSAAGAIDDITISTTDGCAMPRYAAVDTLDTAFVSLYWFPGSGNGNYEVAYGTSNDVDAANVISSITDTAYTVTGLNPGTLYYFWVRNLCTGGDTTLWYYVGKARTACSDGVNAPYVEEFVGYNSYDLPACWTVLQSTDNYGTTAPYVSSSEYLYFYPKFNEPNLIVMPYIRLAANAMNIEVNGYVYSYYPCTFEVGYVTNPDSASTFTALGTISATSYTDYEFNTSAVEADSIWIAFRATTASQYSYAYLSRVRISALGSCIRPDYLVLDTVGADMAELHCNDAGADDYEVRYATVNNVNAESALSEIASDTAIVLSNLNPSTHYYTWVRSLCGSDSSEWRQGPEFTTMCGEEFCLLEMSLHDSWGDGWNGNAINVYSNGVFQMSATIDDGNSNSATLSMCEGDTVVLTWVSGLYASETSFEITHSGIQVVSASGSDYSNGDTIATLAGCPSCMPVLEVVAVDSLATDASVTVTWTPNSEDDDEWAISVNGVVVDVATTNSYTIYNLSPNSGHTVGVATICGGDDTSTYTYVNASTACGGNSCNVIVEMIDSYGDGWNGNEIALYQNGGFKGGSTLTTGAYATANIGVCEGDSIEIRWIAGSFITETSFHILSLAGDTLYAGSAAGEGFVGMTDTVSCPACITPTTINVSNITTSSASLSWNTNGMSTGYIVTVNSAVAMLVDTVITTVPFTITGLQAATSYTVMVSSICGSDTAAATYTTFVTACDEITLPWSFVAANDPSASTYTMPLCWYSPQTYEYYGTVYPTNDGDIAIYGSSGTSCMAATPRIPAAGNNIYVRFNASSYSYNSTTLTAGVMTDPANPATYIPVVNITSADLAEYEFTTESISSLTSADTVYVAFQSVPPSGYGYGYIYLQDVYVQTIPNCHRPDSVVVTNVTDNSATLSWPNTGANNYTVLYDDTAIVVSGTTVTLTGLNAGVTYYVDVQGNCTTDSSLLQHASFTTVCTPQALPWNESFENAANYGTPNCWTFVDQYPNSSGNLSPYVYDYYYYAHTGTKSLVMYGTSTNNTMAISPVLTGEAMNSLYVSFWVYGSGSYGFEAGLMTDPTDTSTFIPLLTVPATTYTSTEYGFQTNSLTSTDSTFHLAIRYTSTASYSGSIYIDDITVMRMPDCSVDFADIAVSGASITDDSATVSWTPGLGINNGATYNVTVLNADNSVLGTYTNVTSPFAFGGLQAETGYRVCVELVCGGSVTAVSDTADFTTRCSGATVASSFSSDMTPTTTNYAPIGFSTWNYSYVQTIIDSAQMAAFDGMQITTMAFLPVSVTAGSAEFGGMNVYMANVSENDLSAGFIMPSATTPFDTVITDANFSFTDTDWQYHDLDTAFTWDGHSNVLVAINRINGTWASSPSFSAHETTAAKTRYVYNDDNAYDISTVSGGYTLDLVGDLMFLACGAGCAEPTALAATVNDYQSATLSWSTDADTVEYAIKAVTDASYPEANRVANTGTYAVSGLTPATEYMFHLRAICEEGDASEWVEVSFVTDSLPCFDPENLRTTNHGYTIATLAWDAAENQSQWEIHVWNSSFDTSYSATGNPFTVTGLAAKTGYSAAVKAICGGGAAESEYSNTIQFTTDSCERVTGVTVSDTTTNSATVSWTSTGASKYVVEYGDYHFNTGDGTSVTVENATSYTITGLRANYDYSVAVKAVCEEGVEGNWSAPVDFSTLAGDGVNTVDGGMSLAIYPNPTSDATTIALSGVSGEVSITIVDMNGRTVKTGTMSCEGDCTKRMEVSGLAQGAYFVRVSGEGVNQVKKLVVK